MSDTISTRGFNWGSFFTIAAACLAALILFNMFVQNKIYSSTGQQVGTSKPAARTPKIGKGGSTSTPYTGMRRVA